MTPKGKKILKMFVCGTENCNRQFSRRYDLNKHFADKHSNPDKIIEKCFLCNQIFENAESLERHYENAHKPRRHFVVKESAFRKKFQTLRYNFLSTETNFIAAQNGIRNKVIKQILTEAAKSIICRVSLIFIAEMAMTDHEGEKMTRATIPFRSTNFFANASLQSNIAKNVRRSFGQQMQALDEFMNSGSNWAFSRALAFDIEISPMKSIRAGHAVNIDNFQNKRYLYNPSNKGHKCLLFCIAYFLLFGGIVMNKLTTLDELKIKKQTRKFVIDGIQFPSSVLDVKRFLRKNQHLNLKINILHMDTEREIFPLEFGLGDGNKVVNLLLVETKHGGHFILIKDLDKYLRKVYRQKNNKLNYQNAFFCPNCLNMFYKNETRNAHVKICSLNKPRIELVPDEKNNIIKFKNYERQHMLDYIAFLDFECILPDKRRQCDQCQSLKCKCDCSITDVVNDQLPIAYSFVVLGPHDEIVHEHTYSGNDAHLDFIKHLLQQENDWVSSLLEIKNAMDFSYKNKIDFNNAEVCYLCKVSFSDDVVKCRDHCHVSGSFLGAACQQCNLRRRRQNKLKIFTHNSSKYDMHFIIKAISSFKKEIKNIYVLPYNGENFRMMSFNCFEFQDSLAFLQASLSQLSHDLMESGHSYGILKQTYLTKKNGIQDMKRLKMVLEKSFFPYEYCTSLEQMLQTEKLPSLQKFYSSLSEETILKKDHDFAKTVWNEFNCKNLIEYTELYCKIDTILLAEIFQEFRKKMFSFSGLDPAHYISLPSYGYDSMLKITESEIELPMDIDIVQFLENGKRGGVSFINTRQLAQDEGGQSDIIYIDRNNLYGEAQMQKLPYSEFTWLTREEIRCFDVKMNCDGDYGYIIECDLAYPKKLHSTHANLPLAPEILEVTYDNLSPYARNALLISENIKKYKDTKLMSTFHDRENYVTHIRNLQLYLSLGMKLLKISRVLKFYQKKFISPYIEKTTEARKNSQTKFEMDLFKKLVIVFFIINFLLIYEKPNKLKKFR